MVFGLDGAFLGTAGTYPLGRTTEWTLLDASGDKIGTSLWRTSSRIVPSPDGAHIVYVAPDTGGTDQVQVRNVVGGPPRSLIRSDQLPLRWTDSNHILWTPVEERGAAHVVDVRDGSDLVAFRPPAAPQPNPAGPDWDSWTLSGDQRWAVLEQWLPNAPLQHRWLYDNARSVFVGELSANPLWLAPQGDIAIAIENDQINVMRLCDQRSTLVGTVPSPVSEVRGMAWSPDGRWAALSVGRTDETRGPDLVAIIDTSRGRSAQILQPWGAIQSWSPDARYVVLSRSGYHVPVLRVASLTFN